MQAATTSLQRFIRRTALHSGEYRKNFHQIDRDAIEVVTSYEACQVTNLMSKVYLRLIDAPLHLREREGVLRFAGEEQEGEWRTAWQQLVSMLGVASATAQKALAWMHEQGVIGYDAHRNGAGIRIFINRATASIGKGGAAATQKILPATRTSPTASRTSPGDTPFKDTFGVQDNLDLSLIPHAPKNGADAKPLATTFSGAVITPNADAPTDTVQRRGEVATAISPLPEVIRVDEIVRQVRSALEPSFKAVAARAAEREHERTREWLERHGIPKATRVAQKEAYNVLRSYGLVKTSPQRPGASANVGRSATPSTVPEVRPRTAEEIAEAAEACIALLEVQHKAVEVTLSEINCEGGGWLLPEDISRVREAVRRAMLERG